MLFTPTPSAVQFCGKASSGSRNITVKDFWTACIIALVPCNHTLAACFPLQGWNMNSSLVYGDVCKRPPSPRVFL